MTKRKLHIDIETYSSVDLTTTGIYPYVESPDFEILMIAYAFDDEPVQIIDRAMGDEFPHDFLYAMINPDVEKHAHNAAFERLCFRSIGMDVPISQWRCSAVKSAYCGLPLSLDGASKALKLGSGGKSREGKALIRYFSMPCKPTKANGGRTRNLPEHDMEKWNAFKDYCIQDVEAERNIEFVLEDYLIPESEWDLYRLDQEINDRGVAVDWDLVEAAIQLDEENTIKLGKQIIEITGVENPTSKPQLKKWLTDNWRPVNSLTKDTYDELSEAAMADDRYDVFELIDLIKRTSKAAIKKYTAMVNAKAMDGRIHGLFQFYGANRTGRWAGRMVQLQNLARNYIKDLDTAISSVKMRDLEFMEIMYDEVSDTLAQLIRTALVAKANHILVDADFSAIEARVIAWLAGEQWVLDAFRNGDDLYKVTYARMTNTPYEKVDHDMRAKGKVAVLACIAEGQLVTTDRGLVPIEKVTPEDMVYDGVRFVAHDGVIFKGLKKVITYEGLTATEDHLVWIEGAKEPVYLGFAAASGAHLQRSKLSWEGLWQSSDNITREKVEAEVERRYGSYAVQYLRECSMDKPFKLTETEIKRMSELLSGEKHTPVVGSSINSGQAEMREPKGPEFQTLRGERHRISLRYCDPGGNLSYSRIWPSGQKIGAGSEEQQRPLRKGKPEICDEVSKQLQQEDINYDRVGSRELALRQKYSEKIPSKRAIERRYPVSSEIGGKEKTKKLETDSQEVRVYDIVNAGPNHRFTVSGVLVHNCGYQGGVGAFVKMGGDKLGMSESDMKHTVNSYRRANQKIVQFWKDLEMAAKVAIVKRETRQVGLLALRFDGFALRIELPSGRELFYKGARVVSSGRGTKILYEGVNQETKAWGILDTYGGKLAENCLAGNSEILTNLGWKNIVDVTTDDLLWDGDRWVTHKGVIQKGIQNTIDVNGVRMTEDHKILTNEGWKAASQVSGLGRNEDSLYYCDGVFGFQREEISMDNAVRLWQALYNASKRILEEKTEVVWMHEKSIDRSKTDNAWHVRASSLFHLEINDRSMPTSDASSVEELRRARYFCGPGMEAELSEFLERHEGGLSKRANTGSERQQWRLHETKLSMGNSKTASPEQENKRTNSDAMGEDNSSRSLREIGGGGDNNTIPNKSGMARSFFAISSGCEEPVYDIVNAGPNNRFMVKGSGGAFIVHNCTQAVARDLLAHSMLMLDLHEFNLVMHIHDEVAAEEPEEEAKEHLKSMENIMTLMEPEWAVGLPLNAEGFVSKYFKK